MSVSPVLSSVPDQPSARRYHRELLVLPVLLAPEYRYLPEGASPQEEQVSPLCRHRRWWFCRDILAWCFLWTDST